MIQVLIVADSKSFIQKIYSLLEPHEDITLNVAFHSTDIFDMYLHYTPDIILIDYKTYLPLSAILKHFETYQWNCLFFINQKPDFFTPTRQTIFFDLEQDSLYPLMTQYLQKWKQEQLSPASPVYIASSDYEDICRLEPDIYFVIMCVCLSNDTLSLSDSAISQLNTELLSIGKLEIFRVFDQDIIISMRKSQMQAPRSFNELHLLVSRITGNPYCSIWQGNIPLEQLNNVCLELLNSYERCYCLGPGCRALSELNKKSVHESLSNIYIDFVKMIDSFFEHDLKAFISCIRSFYAGKIITEGNPAALAYIQQWLSFSEFHLFKQYSSEPEFQYSCIYSSAEQECEIICRHWTGLFERYNKIPYRPVTVQSLHCMLMHHSEVSFSLEEASRKIKFAKTYISRVVKEDTSQSFGDLLLNLRIQHAGILLKITSQSIKEIAYSVGYADAQYFSKVFRKQTGMHPTEFRQSAQIRRTP